MNFSQNNPLLFSPWDPELWGVMVKGCCSCSSAVDATGLLKSSHSGVPASLLVTVWKPLACLLLFAVLEGHLVVGCGSAAADCTEHHVRMWDRWKLQRCDLLRLKGGHIWPLTHFIRPFNLHFAGLWPLLHDGKTKAIFNEVSELLFDSTRTKIFFLNSIYINKRLNKVLETACSTESGIY